MNGLSFLVVLSKLLSSAAPEVGPSLIVNSDVTSVFALAGLDTNRVLLCYFDPGVEDSATCRVASAPALVLTLTTGPAVVHSSGAALDLSAAPIGSGRAVVCAAYEFEAASCAVVTSAGTSLTVGAVLAVGSGNAQEVALAQVGTDKAVACYADKLDSGHGKCSVLTASAASLSSGMEVTFNAGVTAYITLAQLDEHFAVTCFQVQPSPSSAYCLVLSVLGTFLLTGSPFLAATDPSNDVTFLSLTDFKKDNAIFCYKTIAGTCKRLLASGTDLTFGQDLVIDPVASHVRVTHMSGRAVACYRRVNAQSGACNLLTEEPGLLLDKEDAVLVNPGDVTSVDVAPLDENRITMCYAEVADGSKGHCNVVDFAITTSTTTISATTTSETSTMTVSTSSTTSATSTSTSSSTSTTTLLVPVVSVRDTTFIDTDLEVGTIGGPLTWRPPDVLTKVDRYSIFQAPTVDNNENTRVRIGLDVPLGTNTLLIPAGTPVIEPGFILVYTANVHGRQDTIPDAVSVTDIYRPVVNVSDLSFFDVDVDGGEIEGNLTWIPPAVASAITQYHVYLVNDGDTVGDQLELVHTSPVGKNHYYFPSSTLLGNATYFYVVPASPFAESPYGTWHPIVDRAVPKAGVIRPHFVDVDTRSGWVAGNVTWEPPAYSADVDFILVYLAHEPGATGSRRLMGDPANFERRLIGNATVDAGYIVIPPTELGDSVYIVIYTANSVGEQRFPMTIIVADAGLNFEDADLREGLIGGNVTWNRGATAPPLRLRLFVAQGPEASDSRLELAEATEQVTIDFEPKRTILMNAMDSGLKMLAATSIRQGAAGNVTLSEGVRVLSVGPMMGLEQNKTILAALTLPFTLTLGPDVDPATMRIVVPHGTPLGSFAYFQIASESGSGPAALRVGNIVDRAVPTEGVRDVTFRDVDFGKMELAGKISWVLPQNFTAVTRYAVFLADSHDAGPPGRLLMQELPGDASECVLEPNTLYRPWALVLAGNSDGFNESTRGVVRVRDLAVFGRTRAWLESQLCRG